MLPTMHAEPLDAQMPARSRLISTLSPSSPGKLTLSVFASESTGSLLRTAAGNAARIPSHNFSRRGASRAPSASAVAAAISAARAMPTMAATFSVPGLRSLSWLPPNAIRSIEFAPRSTSTPAPFGP